MKDIPPPPLPLILGSASPRRAELLRAAGISFEVVVSPAEEPEEKPGGIPTELWPMCLAYMKATAVRGHLRKSRRRKGGEEASGVILAADTIVVSPAGGILNKARDRGHAREILRSLSGKRHQVITGIALLRGERVRLASATAVCRMKKLSDGVLERYLESGLWRGKAGAYGIQDAPHAGDPFITLLSGDITTVIGLPMPLVLSELASFLKDT